MLVSSVRRGLALLVGAGLVLGRPLGAQTGVAAPVRLEIRRESALPIVMTAADLARLAGAEVRAVEHGRPGTFAGVSLTDVLRRAGVPIDSVRGARTTAYVLVTAADGYRALFSLAELAPDLGGRAVIVADRRDGQPLGSTDGPLRLVVPGDQRPTRWVRQVVAIDIRRAAP